MKRAQFLSLVIATLLGASTSAFGWQCRDARIFGAVRALGVMTSPVTQMAAGAEVGLCIRRTWALLGLHQETLIDHIGSSNPSSYHDKTVVAARWYFFGPAYGTLGIGKRRLNTNLEGSAPEPPGNSSYDPDGHGTYTQYGEVKTESDGVVFGLGAVWQVQEVSLGFELVSMFKPLMTRKSEGRFRTNISDSRHDPDEPQDEADDLAKATDWEILTLVVGWVI